MGFLFYPFLLNSFNFGAALIGSNDHVWSISNETIVFFNPNRDVAQLVECTSGGREAAGSSPVIPTFQICAAVIRLTWFTQQPFDQCTWLKLINFRPSVQQSIKTKYL